jgi:cysteinyl-tRNA synthetase
VTVKVYNTMTRRREELVPLVPGEIRMYVCGVTVYDLSHIGHARSAIVFDVIQRYLRFKGFRVRFVKNYTDVEDKIIRRANAEGVSAREISERYIAEEDADMGALGVLAPDVAPKATEHIPQMITLIEQLIAKNMAYVVQGDVYFEVQRFPAYGRLSGKNLDELLAGARVGVDERKRDPRDFALWKAAKPGEPAWDSPWGSGRPGWHIECSAMTMAHLGASIDIHGGGEDLIFPHHECEIAQAEGATGQTFARYWLHNGMLNLGAEKMSKSLGNTLTIKAMVQRHDAEAIRLYLLGTHYRHPLDFSEERIIESARALERLRSLVEAAERMAAKGTPAPTLDEALAASVAVHRARFEAAMDDDFNTPQALAAVFDLARVLFTARDQLAQGAAEAARPFLDGVKELVVLSQVLGLLRAPAQSRPAIEDELRTRIESLVRRRGEARQRRDFSEADRMREELSRLGVVVEDTSEGTTWKLRP